MLVLVRSLVILATAISATVPSTAWTTMAGESAASQIDYAWDMLCYGDVRRVSKRLKFPSNRHSVMVNDSIKLCTKHLYQYSGKAGQRVTAKITGSTKTWIIISRKGGSRLVVGEREWQGALPENGKYVFEIVTTEADVARYTLQLEIH